MGVVSPPGVWGWPRTPTAAQLHTHTQQSLGEGVGGRGEGKEEGEEEGREGGDKRREVRRGSRGGEEREGEDGEGGQGMGGGGERESKREQGECVYQEMGGGEQVGSQILPM